MLRRDFIKLGSFLALYPSAIISMEGTIKLSAVGDTALAQIKGRGTQKVLPTILENIREKEGEQAMIDYPFKNIKSIFTSSDISFCNLECNHTLSESYISGKGFYIKGKPEYAKCLQGIFDIVNLANNHMLDYREQGMFDTMETLDSLGIKHTGAGKNIEEARKPVIITKKDISVGFLGYCLINPKYFYATEQKPGTSGSFNLELNLSEDIPRLKEKSDIVAVSFHWGIEGSHYPNNTQKYLAHLSVDLGADLILGHHPHVLQGIEEYKNSLIAYSLGNFIFGGNSQRPHHTIILQTELSKHGVFNYKVIPIFAHPPTTKYQPRIADQDLERKVIKEMEIYSKLL